MEPPTCPHCGDPAERIDQRAEPDTGADEFHGWACCGVVIEEDDSEQAAANCDEARATGN